MAFEELALALFSAVWQELGAKLHGRSGQKQHGVDLYGYERERPDSLRLNLGRLPIPGPLLIGREAEFARLGGPGGARTARGPGSEDCGGDGV